MLNTTTDIVYPGLVLVAFLAVLHASFQLATSVLTLISGHSLMHSKARTRLLRLNVAYIFGVLAMTGLLLTGITSALVVWFPFDDVSTLWSALTLAAIVVGTLVMTFYYRQGRGTRIWLPRAFATYLNERSKKTKNVIEAAALGITSVVAELPFTAVLMVMTGLVLASSVMIDNYLVIILLYCFIATLPLIVITTLLAGGHSLSSIQRWRENNKLFLQYASGIGILIAALFVWVNFILLGDTL